MDEGVPASALLLETEATNTGENVTLSHGVMIQKGLHFSRFILVQKPFMERRAYATFLKQWPGEQESVICTSPPIALSITPTILCLSTMLLRRHWLILSGT